MVSATGLYMLLIFAYVSAVESLDTFENAANREALKQKPELHPFILPRNLRSWSFIKPRLGKRTMEDSEGLFHTDSPWDTLDNLEIQDYPEAGLMREGRADMNDAWYPFFTPRPGRRSPSYTQ